jgi:hypothetical protein
MGFSKLVRIVCVSDIDYPCIHSDTDNKCRLTDLDKLGFKLVDNHNNSIDESCPYFHNHISCKCLTNGENDG